VLFRQTNIVWVVFVAGVQVVRFVEVSHGHHIYGCVVHRPVISSSWLIKHL
jgi:hypothetical protein